MADQAEQLKSMLQDIINDRHEQATVTMHDYFVSKTREVAGLAEAGYYGEEAAPTSKIERALKVWAGHYGRDMFEAKGGISYEDPYSRISDFKVVGTNLTFTLTVTGQGNSNWRPGDRSAVGKISENYAAEVEFTCSATLPAALPNDIDVDFIEGLEIEHTAKVTERLSDQGFGDYGDDIQPPRGRR